MSATAILYFGVIFPEEYSFPWDESDDIEDWWIYKIRGLKHTVEIYDADGNYTNDQRPSAELISSYHDERHTFLKENPLPIELDYAGTDECRYTIIAQWIQQTTREGTAISIPEVRSYEALTTFLQQFCQSADKYDDEPSFEPTLRMSSYYGG